MAESKTPQVRYVCETCGSEDVLIDSWVAWNTAEQAWQVADVFESTAYCATCEGECSIKAELITRTSRRQVHVPAE